MAVTRSGIKRYFYFLHKSWEHTYTHFSIIFTFIICALQFRKTNQTGISSDWMIEEICTVTL